MIRSFLNESKIWCMDKAWWWRLPLLGYFVYLLFGYMTQLSFWSVLDWLNLPIHEIGHIIFGWLGEFIGVLGGTLLQCFAPIGAMVNFYLQRDFFAIALCIGWLSTNFFGVSRYIADARVQELCLVTIGGGEAKHDWHYLLGKMGLLTCDTLLAGLVFGLALLTMIICFMYGGWLLWKMAVKQ